MKREMLKLTWRTVLPLAVVALTACSTMSRPECEVSDWHSVGFEDGAKGASVARIGDYRKTCSKYNVSPDLDAYRSGYAQGVETYCREANGFNVGSGGGAYGGICPAELEEDFLTGYRDGRHLYELNAAVNAVSGQISNKRYALHQVKDTLATKEAALLDKITTDSDRVLLAKDIYELGRRQGTLESEIAALERELGARREELGRFRESLAYNR
jgi:Protein of unknown function (DUF2799)